MQEFKQDFRLDFDIITAVSRVRDCTTAVLKILLLTWQDKYRRGLF